ncbi:Deoxycytidine monophosphate (dCMP) deaminase, partial [Linderina macrospora]
MFIGIIGTIARVGSKASGKEEVAQYLVNELQFTRLRIRADAPVFVAASTNDSQTEFRSAKDMLTFTTPRWRTKYVTTDVTNPIDLYLLLKRPFFMVVGIDAPLGLRYRRYTERSLHQGEHMMSLEEFIAADDEVMYSAPSPQPNSPDLSGAPAAGRTEETMPRQLMSPIMSSTDAAQELNVKRMVGRANVTITNTFETVEALREHLERLDLLNGERLRPAWDTYFMLLSELASHRANCMKRK